ncbi:hypothetical protein HA402_009663 [Bradysia odoriphaga]|nr:hypothetical protein HA402_009663 [Bradysia odoriphaga]
MPQLRKRQLLKASPKSAKSVPQTSTVETDQKFSTINIDVRSCFVCRKDTSIFSENLLKINTAHSDTPVLKYIEKFIGYPLVKHESFEKLIICKGCMTKIDEFDKAYITAKLVQIELRELLHASVQSIEAFKANETVLEDSTSHQYIVTDVDDNAATPYVPTNILEEVANNDNVKLEIEILDAEENLDESYQYDMDDANVECLEEYEIIEEQENLDEEYFESHLSDTEELLEEMHSKENDFDYGDCITMTCDLCNTDFKSVTSETQSARFVVTNPVPSHI